MTDTSGSYVKVYEKDKSVWDATCERFDYLFDQYDRIVVSFSGGKDSTYVLYEIVVKHKLKPLVISFDHGFYRQTLIENNKRREGPVINFSNQERLIEHINQKKLGANKISNYFWRSQINPIQFKKSYKGTVQEKYLDKAISLLESFRNKESKVDEVFDIDQLAKLMALRAIFGSNLLISSDKFFISEFLI